MIDLKVEGVKELLRKFEKLDRRLGKRILNQAVRAGAKPIIAEARNLVKPLDRTGLLRKSLGVKVKVYKKDGAIVAIIGPRKEFSGVYNGKKVRPSNYAHLVHNGFTDRAGKFHPGIGFLTGSLASKGQESIATIRNKLRDGILNAAK